jgi:hypothetical protein
MSYDIHLDEKFGPLTKIDVAAEAAQHQPWFNQTLTRVDDAVVRLGVLEGDFHWHKHDGEDEFFLVLEGKLSNRGRGPRDGHARAAPGVHRAQGRARLPARARPHGGGDDRARRRETDGRLKREKGEDVIDASCPQASWFLWIAPTLFLIVYALPLAFAPFRWARAFRWQVNERDDLALYFGRCVGALAIVLCAACFRAAPHPRANPLLFEIIAGVGVAMTVLHIVGALQRRQPWTETIEIALYAGLAALALVLRP